MSGPIALLSAALILAVLVVVLLAEGGTRKRRHRASREASARAPASPLRHDEAPQPVVGADSQPVASADVSLPLGIPKLRYEEDDEELTLVTLGPQSDANPLDREQHAAVPIVYDEDAAIDEPTSAFSLILVSAVGQTDRGKRRRKNEDAFLVLDARSLYVIADGMGGHAGGEVASALAVETMETAFTTNQFPGAHHTSVPRRASELVLAIQAANAAIYQRAQAESRLEGMGTTVVGARFSLNKQRLYVGHVGDSRCYRLRGTELRQMTTDHTMEADGYMGPQAAYLTRSVGVAPKVRVDLIVAKPQPGDVYLLCSDGLSKMVSLERIRETLLEVPEPENAVARLIASANDSGGRDNVTVIVVRAQRPVGPKRVPSRTAGVPA